MKRSPGSRPFGVPFLLLPLLIGTLSCQRTTASTPGESSQKMIADLHSSTMNGSSQDIVGWNGVAWGTTRDQAEKLLSACHASLGPKKEDRVVIGRFKIRHIECAVTLLFDETGLHRVVLRPTSNLEIPDFTFQVLKEGLMDKYGPAAEREMIREVDFRRTVTSWIWPRPHGTATLEYAVPINSQKPIIKLTYAKKTVLPEL
jgi:hypothetical protein